VRVLCDVDGRHATILEEHAIALRAKKIPEKARSACVNDMAHGVNQAAAVPSTVRCLSHLSLSRPLPIFTDFRLFLVGWCD